MRNFILILFLVIPFALLAQNQQASKTYTDKEVDLMMLLQQKEIDRLQEELHNQKAYITEEISRQNDSIEQTSTQLSKLISITGNTLAYVSILFTIFSIGVAVAIYILNKGFRRDYQNLCLEVKVFKEEAEDYLEKIKNLEKYAKTTTESLDEMAQRVARSLKETTPEEQSKEGKEEISEIVNKINKEKPEHQLTAEEWFLKGYDAYINGNYTEAKVYYDKAIKLKPDYAEAHNNLGSILSREQLHEDSIRCYRKAIELNPTLALAHLNLGISLTQYAIEKDSLKDYKGEILASLEKANGLGDDAASFNISCLYSLLNENDEAFEWLGKDIQVNSKKNPKEKYLTDTDFDNIKDDPRFSELLDKYYPEGKHD